MWSSNPKDLVILNAIKIKMLKKKSARLSSLTKVIGAMILIVIFMILLFWGLYLSNSIKPIEKQNNSENNVQPNINIIKDTNKEDTNIIIKIIKRTYRVFDKGYCGNNICTSSEIGWCYSDCEWCGDGFCENENCENCAKDCGNCSASNYCGNGICTSEKCISGCTKDCKISDCIDGICNSRLGENCLSSSTDCGCAFGEYCENGECKGGYCGNKMCSSSENCATCPGDCVCEILKKCVGSVCKTYCGNGVCESDETKTSCSQDCGEEKYNYYNNPDENYPLILVHGHSTYSSDATFSVAGFNEFQAKLDLDKLYKNMAVILPNSNINSYEKGEWGRFSEPISIRTTYYIGILDSSGSFSRTDNAQRSINEYAQRLGRVVDIVLHHTGKNKVVIAGHSMGGLVARAYIKNYNGSDKVDKLVMIGTPNHGFFKEDMYNYIVTRVINCAETHPGQECMDMYPGSVFLNNLNNNSDGNETFGNVNYLTIAGNCCSAYNREANDETIRVSSVNLKGAKNFVVYGSKSADEYTFHGNLITPSKNPLVYNYTVDFLRG